MAQAILDLYPAAVSDHGLLGCLAFTMGALALLAVPVIGAILAMLAVPETFK